MNPLTIYQQVLDIVSNAVMTGRFDLYAALIDLPYLVHTDTARFLITTVEDLHPTFDTLSQGLAARGVTHYERVARAADYVDRDRIEGLHYTYLIANGESVAYPLASRHAIVRRGEVWFFSEAHYRLKADSWPIEEKVIFSASAMAIPGRGVA